MPCISQTYDKGKGFEFGTVTFEETIIGYNQDKDSLWQTPINGPQQPRDDASMPKNT